MLLEVLVAFVVLAIALTAILGGFASGLSSLRITQGHAEALLHARSKLDEVGSVIPLQQGAHEGALDGDIRWQTEILPIEGESPASALYSVAVTVSWDTDRSITLTTLRIGPLE